jgi:AAA+ superfamily predicted ATPase
MAQQTAVEWLEEQFLRERFVYDFDFDKAKEMEKQQIMKAYLNQSPIEDGVITALQKADQYFTQTYGK